MITEGRLASLRIEAHPRGRSLHVCATNDCKHPADLYFEGKHLWRLTLLDAQGRVQTFHVNDPVRHLYWSKWLEAGSSVAATFSGLPVGTFDARLDFFAAFCDPLFLRDLKFE